VHVAGHVWAQTAVCAVCRSTVGLSNGPVISVALVPLQGAEAAGVDVPVTRAQQVHVDRGRL
jgi:hypothetical protein